MSPKVYCRRPWLCKAGLSLIASRSKESEVVYPMHPACWEIFCQQHAIIAVRNPSTPNLDYIGAILASQEVEEEGRGLQPDWAVDYAGAENFWGDGWSWTEDTETSAVRELLDETPDLDFIVFDPGHVSLPSSIIQHPPLLSTDSERKDSLSPKSEVIFSRLPIEILHMVFGFLPTPSVRAFRLSSRLIASVPLANTFWRSRFDFPHELSHVHLPKFLTSRRTNSPVDWKALRECLLSSLNRQNKYWQNRGRINALTTKLVHRVLAKDVISQDSQAQALQKRYVCRQSFSCSGQKIISQETVYFDAPAHDVRPKALGFTFQSRKLKPTIVGIAFSGPAGLSALGKFSANNAQYSTLGAGECLRGFIVGLAAEGFVGIKVIVGLNDSQDVLREQQFGSFEDNVALGRLLAQEGSTIVGLQTGHSKVSHEIHRS